MSVVPVVTRRQFAGLWLGGASVALTGCAGGLALLNSAPTLYTLTPKSTFDEDLPTVEWQLLIEIPAASAGLDTPRIALLRMPVRLDYFADVAWTTRAPEMVQTLLVESFENSGRIVSVGRESIGLRADYVLKTELREFQAEYFREGQRPEAELQSIAPLVRVGINAKLVKIPEREIIAGENFEAVEVAEASTMDSIILAFDEALGKVLRRIVEWGLTQGQANWQRTRSG